MICLLLVLLAVRQPEYITLKNQAGTIDEPTTGGDVRALTQDTVRSLAGFKGQDGPVVTLYLDVDGRRHVRPRDYEVQLEALLRQAGPRIDGDAATAAQLQRIESFVKAGLDRSRTRGLAVFACRSPELWQVIELPVPVRNQLVVNATPHVRQLEAVLDEYERFAVLLADKQRARLFVFELGELVEKSELFDQLPRHEDDRGDRRRDEVRGHSAEVAHQHLKRAAHVAFEMFKVQPFDHLIVGAPDEIANELERDMHSYLRDRIRARLSIPVGASEAVVREAALDVEQQVERAKEAELVTRLRDAVGARAGGVAGLADTVAALTERRVDTLVVSEGYEAPGWRCHGCGHVALKGRACPLCGRDMHQVDDVVEEAIDEALAQSCRVEVVVGNADLDVLGRIGALLRF
jgi:peptide chain release factor subunit 1